MMTEMVYLNVRIEKKKPVVMKSFVRTAVRV